MSEQTRVVVFILLALVIFLVWSKYFAPQPPPAKPQQPQTAQTAPAPGSGQAKALPAKPAQIPVIEASSEKTVVVENGDYRVELSNRGAVAKSWKLQKYLNLDNPPQPLDLVHANAASQLVWPLSLVLSNSQEEQKANTALYQMEPAAGELRAPTQVTFRWSDGHLAVTKTLQFGQDYQVSMDVSVTEDGKPVPVAVAWRGGFGDASVDGWAEKVNVFYNQSGSVQKARRIRQSKPAPGDRWSDAIPGHRRPILRRGLLAGSAESIALGLDAVSHNHDRQQACLDAHRFDGSG